MSAEGRAEVGSVARRGTLTRADADGNVGVPSGWGGSAHRASHQDVQDKRVGLTTMNAQETDDDE